MKTLIGIDIGVVHLGFAVGHTTDVWTELALASVDVIDTMVLEHRRVPRSECHLQHTGMAADRVAHVVQERQALFDGASVIVVERQPPGGLRDVEQVFVCMFRDRVHIMAPATMHACIGSSKRCYSERKLISIAVACRYMPDLTARFPKPDDAADAVCMLHTYAKQAAERARVARQRAEAHAVARGRGLDLAVFEYKGYFKDRRMARARPPTTPSLTSSHRASRSSDAAAAAMASARLFSASPDTGGGTGAALGGSLLEDGPHVEITLEPTARGASLHTSSMLPPRDAHARL
jgi:hypothetical protein